MPEGSKKDKTEAEEAEDTLDNVEIMTNIPGVGPKTAQKLVEAGFSDLGKVSVAEPEELAASVPGLSPAKAEDVVKAAAKLKEDVDAGVIDLTTKGKKAKRKKAPEPEPEVHELPPAKEIAKAEIRSSLKTGLEDDKMKKGIPVGPKWLTKFEKARIIGARALQISMGAPVLIGKKAAPTGLFSLAEAELRAKALPMTVRRTLPTGEHFDIPLSILLESTRLD